MHPENHPSPSVANHRPGEFTVGFSFDHDLFLIEAFGELDLATAPELEEVLGCAEQTDAERIMVDLSGLDFIDCAGLAVLRNAAQRSALNGARLRILRGPDQVQRVFELCDFETELPFSE